MSRFRHLARLSELSQLMLDHRLGLLRVSAEQLDQSRMQMSAVNQTAKELDLDPVTAAQVGLSYERWADVRRAELNLVIARQTAAWLETRHDAQIAFGRLQALEGLAARLKAEANKSHSPQNTRI
jgi:hypothetical protein